MPGSSDSNQTEGSQHLQLLVDAVVDYAIYMIGPQGHIITWNSGAHRLMGYTASEIIGEPFSKFYTPEDRAAGIPEKALEVARREGRFHAEGWRVRKDGTRFWALVVIDAITDDSGKLIGFAKVTRDFTERQHAQTSLLESERRYRRLVESVIDYAIFQLDANGIVATWNLGAERIKGYSAEEIVGQHFSRFYSEEDRAAGVPGHALETARATGKYEAEGWRLRKNGEKFWAFVVIDAIYDEERKIIGFAKVTRDVTERHEAQEQLKVLQEQLAISQKMEAVGQLSGGIAHDFNNLLMIVLGNLETAQRHVQQTSNAPPNVQRALSNAMRGAQRAAALTSRLLAFSRRQPLDPKPIDVNKFLAGSVDFLQRSLGEILQVEAVGAAGLWMIEADVNQLESALVNLAINARDAMPEGGKLTVEASNSYADAEYIRANPEVVGGQYVVISVSDNGAGMPPDVQSRVFEPFFTTKEAGHGTGLGLSQVYGFVKQSGGHVKIYSELGQGTTVKMYFPRLSSGEETNEEADDDPYAEGEGNETILVVEDDRDVRSYLTDALRDLNYRVITRSDAQSALTILSQLDKRVDLLLTDVVMPGQNGRELGSQAEILRPGLPVLYLTGYSRNAVVHQGRLDQGVELLQKPVTKQQLAARIRALLDAANAAAK
jgi:PAS domain S-box-containing protein